MIKKLLLLAAILAVPSLSFGAPTVCTVVSGFAGGPLTAGGSVTLIEGAPESGSLSCPGLTFNVGPSGSQTFNFYDDGGHLSDIVTFSNGLGGPASIAFTSDVCGVGCVDNVGSATDLPAAVFVTATNGMIFRVASDNDPNTTTTSDIVSASPEPATFATFGTGLLVLAGFLRRKLHS
jgi:hypothetical protein